MTPRTRLQATRRAVFACLTVLLMIAVGLIMQVLATSTSPAMTDPATAEPTDFGIAMGGAGMVMLPLLLPWYRKAPLVVMGGGALSATVLQLDPFILAVGLTVWMARCRRAWQWSIAGAGLALIPLNAVIHLRGLSQWPDPDYQRTGQVLVITGTLLCLGLVLGISLWVRQRRSIERAEADAQSAQRSSAQLNDELARQRERENLAREVHDTLAGRLSGLSLQVGSLEKSAQHGGGPQLDAALRTTRGYADQALSDLRLLLTSLREGGAAASAPAQSPGGIEDLQHLLDDAAAAGLDIRPYILLDGYATAPEPLRRAVLRITQEALTNALRHSLDRVVSVRIGGDRQRGVHLAFVNRSTGESGYAHGAGTGLIGIRERAELLGGGMAVEQRPGEFALSVQLPWHPGPEDAPA